MLSSPPVFLAQCMRRALPVAWPVDWRVTAAQNGLYCVEGKSENGWRLMALAVRLGDAFALGEALHAGPDWFARICDRTEAAALPAAYAQPTDEGWDGSLFRTALADRSFALDLEPNAVFRAQSWRRILKRALLSVGRGESVVLLGEAGAGKTLFMRDLAEALAFEGRKVALLHGDEAALTVGAEIVLVDQADGLGQEALAARFGAGRPVILAGRPGLEARLASAGPGAAILQLEPLAAQDVARFVATRLRHSGREPRLIDAEAVLALTRLSAGLPRQLNVLAGAAMFLADLECAPRLLVRHVEHAALAARPGGVRLQSPPRAADAASAPRRSGWAGARFGAAVAGLAVVLLVSWASRQASEQVEFVPLVPTAYATLEQADASPAQLLAPVPAPAAAPAEAQLAPPTHRVKIAEPAVASLAAAEPPAPFAAAPSGSMGRLAAHLAMERDAASVFQASVGSFKGPVNNETLRVTGQLSLDMVQEGSPGAVRARFHAWDGLIGTGELSGTVASDGRVTLSGQLSMGRNPFLCRLTGVIKGDRFTGTAQFVRPWGGRIAHSSFNLLKT